MVTCFRAITVLVSITFLCNSDMTIDVETYVFLLAAVSVSKEGRIICENIELSLRIIRGKTSVRDKENIFVCDSAK